MLDLCAIGNKIYTQRRKHQLSQEALAEKLLVSHQAISRWETGKALPSIDNLCMLSDLFTISIEELLCLRIITTANDPEELLLNHSRQWVIYEIVVGQLDGFLLTDILHLLSKDERNYAFYLMITKNIPIKSDLWSRLSMDERYRFLNQYLKNDYPLPIANIYHLLTESERNKIKGVKR